MPRTLAALSFVEAGPVHQTRGFGYLAWKALLPPAVLRSCPGVGVAQAAVDTRFNGKRTRCKTDSWPDCSFVKAGPVHQTRGFGYLAWNVVAPGSDAPIVSGFDVALISDERITDLFTVITASP